MYAGCAIYIIAEEIRFDLEELYAFFTREQITHTFMTTHLGRMFAESGLDSDLKVLFVAGEKLGEFGIRTSYKVMDGYGPTESLALVTQIPVCDRTDPSSGGG